MSNGIEVNKIKRQNGINIHKERKKRRFSEGN